MYSTCFTYVRVCVDFVRPETSRNIRDLYRACALAWNWHSDDFSHFHSAIFWTKTSSEFHRKWVIPPEISSGLPPRLVRPSPLTVVVQFGETQIAIVPVKFQSFSPSSFTFSQTRFSIGITLRSHRTQPSHASGRDMNGACACVSFESCRRYRKKAGWAISLRLNREGDSLILQDKEH